HFARRSGHRRTGAACCRWRGTYGHEDHAGAGSYGRQDVSVVSGRGVGAVCGALTTVMLALPASAHISVQPKEASADSYFQLAFSVPHGCDGSATVALRVKMPDGIISTKPQMKPGW